MISSRQFLPNEEWSPPAVQLRRTASVIMCVRLLTSPMNPNMIRLIVVIHGADLLNIFSVY